MLRLALSGIRSRKLRLLLTSVAVVLGTGFVTGAFIFTDAARGSFANLFDESVQNIDVNIQSKQQKQLHRRADNSPPGTVAISLEQVAIPPDVVDQVAAVDGVRRVAGSVFEIGILPLDRAGKPIGSQGPPSFAASWSKGAEDIGALRIVKGAAPDRDEVMLDQTTFDDAGFDIGDDVTMLVQGGRTTETFRLSGVVRFGETNSLAGARISVFDLGTVQRLLDMGDRLSSVDAQADPGVSQRTLKRRIAQRIGGDYDVLTGSEFSREQQEALDQSFLRYVQWVLLAFAGVALFVGAFTIFNTFAILVGQRVREFGMLRAIGARRRQIFGIVALETSAVGLIGTLLGIAFGFLVALGLRALINGVLDGAFPGDALELRTRTVVAAFGVGMFVTLVAAFVPSLRASRLSPIEAMQGTSTHGRGHHALVVGCGFVLTLAGVALVGLGSFGEFGTTRTRLLALGAGFGVTILGVTLLSRLLVRPLARLMSPLVQSVPSGVIAVGNLVRNTARASVTAAALMIGLALATLVLAFYSSISASIDQEIDAVVGADVSVYNSAAIGSASSALVSDEAVRQIAEVEGVRSVEGQRVGGYAPAAEFDPDGTIRTVAGLSPEALRGSSVLRLTAVDGSVEGLDERSVLVDETVAERDELGVGDTYEMSFSTGETRRLQVAGIYETTQIIDGGVIMSTSTFDEVMPPSQRAAAFVYVALDSGRDGDRVARAITRELGDDGRFLEVQSTADLRDQFTEQIRPILAVVLAMLALSLIVAVFGIANTLSLSVLERTREIGLLRAVGTTRAQTAVMVLLEGIFVAAFGAILGVALGLAAAAAILTALRDEGFVLAIDPLPIIAVLVVGILAGVAASMLPARRAARMRVLDAVASE